ncbi:MAG TPA: hypothetical protein VME46_10515 [Acidimicrobiales bacterium]|nr:hypothetical protein [Acidimicrobiales bacterium]
MWAVLPGANLGPVVLVSGPLASLLWLSSLRRLHEQADPRDFIDAGLRRGYLRQRRRSPLRCCSA